MWLDLRAGAHDLGGEGGGKYSSRFNSISAFRVVDEIVIDDCVAVIGNRIKPLEVHDSQLPTVTSNSPVRQTNAASFTACWS